LEWTETSEDQHDAHHDRAHFVVHKRSRGKPWGVAIFSMFTDEPGLAEERLAEYEVSTLEDGKELAQALADQHGDGP